jgi:hypothetical protein
MDLRKLSRLGEHAQLATVERWAKRVGIRYQYDGRGGIWTSVDGLYAALGISAKSTDTDESYRVEAVI